VLRCFGYWDFPKGEVESGEKPLDAAIREVHEETGLSGLRFRWGTGYFETAPYGRGKVARYYVAEAPAGEVVLAINQTLGRPEHHEYRWAQPDAARALLVPRVAAAMNWAIERADPSAE